MFTAKCNSSALIDRRKRLKRTQVNSLSAVDVENLGLGLILPDLLIMLPAVVHCVTI